jgi:tRNA pseudouridine55 synthase
MQPTEAIFAVLKPPGMSSHDVVDFLRRLLQVKRVGHAGTLDVAAAGLLLVMSGRYTRLSPYLMDYEKTYRAELTFGIATSTGDADGPVIHQQPAPHLTAEQVATALAKLVGLLLMKPHRFSAARVQGRKAYELARAGAEPELSERAVVVYQAEVLAFEPGEYPRALVELRCGKGTYVRSLAEVVGRHLGTCAYASFMLRTAIGPLTVNEAHTLAELEALAGEGRLLEAAIPVRKALDGYPSAQVTGEQARRLASGTPVPFPGRARVGDKITVWDPEGRLVAVAEIRGAQPQLLQPRTVLAAGE